MGSFWDLLFQHIKQGPTLYLHVCVHIFVQCMFFREIRPGNITFFFLGVVVEFLPLINNEERQNE